MDFQSLGLDALLEAQRRMEEAVPWLALRGKVKLLRIEWLEPDQCFVIDPTFVESKIMVAISPQMYTKIQHAAHYQIHDDDLGAMIAWHVRRGHETRHGESGDGTTTGRSPK